MDAEKCGDSVHTINVLTVIASEGYNNFVADEPLAAGVHTLVQLLSAGKPMNWMQMLLPAGKALFMKEREQGSHDC